MTETLPAIAIIGGTGNLGAALARRLVAAGRRVLIGSRDAARARAGAEALGPGVGHGTNAEVAGQAEVIIVAVPFSSQKATLQDIAPQAAGKIVVDTTVPLVPPKVMRVQLPPEGSAAMIAQSVLGPGVRVVSAFHNVAAHKLASDEPVECDVLVFGDDRKARDVVVAIAADCGLRGLHAGALVNSAAAEALTSVIIFINKTYGADGAGMRITGQLVPPSAG
jgi:NADPH-dependent F420 reductase